MRRRYLLALAGVAGGAAWWRQASVPARPLPPVLRGGPLLIAHRGGAGLAPENTLRAFGEAVSRWRADMIELDVHATADGRCVVIHDPTVDRTTDGSGAVASMTLGQLEKLDAGYRFTTDGGRTYPFRGRGVKIPTFDEVLDSLPGDTRLTVELKTGAAQEPLLEALARAGAEDRVIIAGEREEYRTRFGGYPGAISGSARQVLSFFVFHRAHLARLARPRFQVAQIPESWGGRRVVTRRLVADLRAHGIPVHVWTVNEAADMARLLDLGVDGLVTDRPDRLAALLAGRSGGARTPSLDPSARG